MNLGSCRACTSQVSWCAGVLVAVGGERGGGSGAISGVLPKSFYFPTTYLLKKISFKVKNEPPSPRLGEKPYRAPGTRPRLGLRAQPSDVPPSIISRTCTLHRGILYRGAETRCSKPPCSKQPPSEGATHRESWRAFRAELSSNGFMTTQGTLLPCRAPGILRQTRRHHESLTAR